MILVQVSEYIGNEVHISKFLFLCPTLYVTHTFAFHWNILRRVELKLQPQFQA
jgi:hypothetical protein